jgi:hypothetical protein
MEGMQSLLQPLCISIAAVMIAVGLGSGTPGPYIQAQSPQDLIPNHPGQRQTETVSIMIKGHEHRFNAMRGEALVVFKDASIADTRSMQLRSDQGPIQLDVRRIINRADNPVYKVANPSLSAQELLSSLNRDTRVVYAEPVFWGRFCQQTGQAVTPNDQYWALQATSNMDAIRVPDMFGYQQANPGTVTPMTIAVLDSLSELTHEDLPGGTISGIDFRTASEVGLPSIHAYTTVGEMAAKGDNGIDLCGIDGLLPEVDFLPLQVGDEGGVYSDAALAAFTYCADNAQSVGIRALNCSFAGLGPSFLIENELTRLRMQNVQVVAAAGNDAIDLDANPDANWFGVTVSYLGMLIGGTDPAGHAVDPESDTCSCVAGAAPSQSVITLGPGNGVGAGTGTSLAAPQYTGMVPQLVELYPGLDPFDQRARFVQTRANSSELVAVGGLLDCYSVASAAVTYPSRDSLKIKNLVVSHKKITLTIQSTDPAANVLCGGAGVTVTSRTTRRKAAKSLTDIQMTVATGSTALFASSSGGTLDRVLN